MDAASLPEDNSMGRKYRELQKQLAQGTDLSALETDVYSALYSFFNRYYEEGDFISKRRYKEGVYAIPYEGEESKVFIRIPLHFGGICGQMGISGDCPSVLFSLLVGFRGDLF